MTVDNDGMVRVMVVDDDPDIAELVAFVLTEHGYESRAVLDSREALSVARAWHPDALLLDLMMPDPDGFAVARLFRATPETAAIPIIVMTAMHAAEERASLAGVAAWLGKPFDVHDLTRTVQRVVHSSIDRPAC